MSPAVKNGLLIVLILAAVGLAAWQMSRPSDDERAPDTPDTRTAWMCATCGRIERWTARQVEDNLATPGRAQFGDEVGARQTRFYCDTCQSFTILRADWCGFHQRYYLTVAPDGRPLGCPDCRAGRPAVSP